MASSGVRLGLSIFGKVCELHIYGQDFGSTEAHQHSAIRPEHQPSNDFFKCATRLWKLILKLIVSNFKDF